MTDRHVEYVPLGTVQTAPRNPKQHAETQIRASIDRFGLGELPLIDERTGRLVAGHGRIDQLAAMQAAGQAPPDGVHAEGGDWLVPVVRGWASRSDAEAEAYLVASNKLTAMAGWDDAGLTELLSGLDDDLLALTGFTGDELAALMAAPDRGGQADVKRTDDTAADEPPVDPITKPGDIWQLGPHRVICGDCRDPATLGRLLGDIRVTVAFTSPPYASQRKYDESSGFRPIPPAEYVDWFENVQANVRAVLATDGSWFVNIKEHCDDGQRHLYVKDLTIAHVRRWAWRFVDELCWVDTRNGFPGTFPNRFKDAWEPVFHYVTGGAKTKFRPLANGHASNDVLRYDPASHMDMGEHGYRVAGDRQFEEGIARPSNVISIAAGGEGVHSAAFPVALPAWFIRAYSDAGDAVLDPFMGSGTTLIAAHNERRVGFGSEISPAYVDVICRRYQKHTGDKPVLLATGDPHDFEVAR